MNILIVDDQPTNLKLLRAQLEAEGHSIVEAADGVEALQVLQREPVDALISDILMPNMDGYRLCREVRRSPQFCALPFILYTSTYTSPNDMKLAQSVGADRYLVKPAPVESLLAALREVISRKGAPAVPPVEESYVLKLYNEALVKKLEEKNAELHQTLEALQRTHDRVAELNASLERRVQERTAELEVRNRELTEALENVKELSGLLPICSYCKKIRDSENYWHRVESYLTRHSKAELTHGICPECLESVRADLQKRHKA
jgi:CheY-like chemotaxis protein